MAKKPKTLSERMLSITFDRIEGKDDQKHREQEVHAKALEAMDHFNDRQAIDNVAYAHQVSTDIQSGSAGKANKATAQTLSSIGEIQKAIAERVKEKNKPVTRRY